MRGPQIPDAARLSKVLKARLKEYNTTLPKPLALVFFADAVEHVCRIARLLRQPRESPLGLYLMWSSHVALNWGEVGGNNLRSLYPCVFLV